LWNLKTGICIRTMDCGYAICSVFLPGDRHVSRHLHGLVRSSPCSQIACPGIQVVVGTKGGTLELFDLPSATLLQTVQAHSGPIWGIDVRPDKGGLVTGSADKDVKFWDIRMREVAGEGSKILTRLGEERVVSLRRRPA
jgi:U3 small nucleolar RNA-associated protein 12